MLSINIERIWANSRLILTMTTIIIHRLFVDVQIHNIFHKLIRFHLCKFYTQKKKKGIRVRLVHVFKNWKLLFKKFCGNTSEWKSLWKYVKCYLKTENCCLETFTKHPLSSSKVCKVSISNYIPCKVL